MTMKIHESAENYLETILVLEKRLDYVRSIDIVNEMNFSKPSVSIAMSKLKENGFIRVDNNGHIFLLEPGREIAEKIYERHTVISGWLISKGVPEKVALEDACKIEHVISEEAFEVFKKEAKTIS
jgi:Mn-dependent DtxR family transcriptional regulator